MRSVTENQTITRTSTRTEERQVVMWPLAQTFLIDDEGGVFLTSIDIFFSTKDAYIDHGSNKRCCKWLYRSKDITVFRKDIITQL